MKIAHAAQEDLEAVVRLEREVPEAPHWAAMEYAKIAAAEHGVVPRCLLVCRREGALAGFAVGKVVAGEAELETIVVRPSVRRGGVGKALCATVIGWAWEQGTAAMELEVRASSVGAIAFYAGLGFVQVGRRRGYYKDPAEDAVLMRLTRAEPLRDG